MNKRVFGHKAETRALEFLEGQGLGLMERNCYLGRIGEIDLVMKEAATGEIVFVEVRSLQKSYLRPEEVLPQEKLRNLIRCARVWLCKAGLVEYQQAHRIDLVVVDFREQPIKINWFKRIL